MKIDGLTSKQRHKKSRRKKSGGLCEICHSPNMVQHHHIIHGKGKRKQCETVYSLIALCWNCHHGNYGVHGKNGKALDTKLKQDLQRKYEELGLKGKELQYWLGGRYYL